MNNGADIMPYFAKAKSSQEILLKLLKRVSALEKKAGIKLDHVRGNIKVEGIDFAYPSRPHITVLKDFDLEIKAGNSVALVGK